MDVGGYRLYILGVFFYHALSLFTTLSGPPCHCRYIYSGKRLPDAEGIFDWVPFRDSSERGRVQEGE